MADRLKSEAARYFFALLKEPSCKGPDNNQLQWKCHNKILAISRQVIRYEIAGEAIITVHPQQTGESNLSYYREGLYCENNKNRSVFRMHDPESTRLCQMTGYKVGEQGNDDIFYPHSF